MDNLTRLVNRENNWYKIGPIPVARGVPKRVPFYFVFLLIIVFALSYLPFTPFWILQKIGKGGWIFNYIVFPGVGAALLQSLKTGGKKPEKYLWTLIRFKMSDHRVNPYRKVEQTTYSFGTGYTYRITPRKEHQ